MCILHKASSGGLRTFTCIQSELSVHIYVIICSIENNVRISCSIDLKCYYDYILYRVVRLVLKGCCFMAIFFEYCICICLVLLDHRCK